MSRPIFASISTAALKHNLKQARHYAPQAKIMAVVKANAYGHGLLAAASALAEADGFGVVELDEAIALREAGIRQTILLLSGFFSAAELLLISEYRLSIVIHCQEQLESFLCSGLPVRTDIFLKMNTGMNRLGFAPSEFLAAAQRLLDSGQAGNITFMTHFACAEEPGGIDEASTLFFKTIGDKNFSKSLANSAALIRYPETHCDWVRPGIILYGASPFQEESAVQLGLLPVMSLQSEIIAIQNVLAGGTVGYGKSFTAEKPMRIGIAACGYADGYPRHAPSGTPIAVSGQRTTTVGRVAMDMLCVDLTGLDSTDVGSKVTLWGEDISVDEVARAASTVSYELLCALARRVKVIVT